MVEKRCETCVHFSDWDRARGHDFRIGSCLRFPPVPVFDMREAKLLSKSPEVSLHFRCGEWRGAESDVAEEVAQVMRRYREFFPGNSHNEGAPRVLSLGSQVRTQREKLGLSQQQLADMAGISQTTIDKVEQGITRRTKYLPEIVKVLGLDLDGVLS